MFEYVFCALKRNLFFCLLGVFIGLNACSSKYQSKGEYIGGFASVELNGKYGIIDEGGKEIVTPKYEEVGNFVGEFAKIKLNNKYGFVNKKGEEVVPPKYDKIYGFNGAFAKMVLNSKFGMLDRNAKEVVPPKYDAVNYNIIGKFFEVSENGAVTRIEYKVQ